jgi:hypothetical protein
METEFIVATVCLGTWSNGSLVPSGKFLSQFHDHELSRSMVTSYIKWQIINKSELLLQHYTYRHIVNSSNKNMAYRSLRVEETATGNGGWLEINLTFIKN